jgi:tetratricopeptide (TPR) repeat protein
MLRRSEAIAARDSNIVYLYITGLTANRLLRPHVALPALLASDSVMRATGWAPQVNVLAETYHLLGRHEEELATIEQGRRLFPANRALLARGLRAHAALRRPAAALALADTVARTAADSLGADLNGVLTGAAEFRAHGDSVTARRLAAMMLDWFAAHPLRTPAPARAERVGLAFLELGQLDSAERHLRVAARDTTCCAAAYLAAVRFARDGDRAALLRVADSLGADRRRWQFGSGRFAQAALVARVDRDRAMTLLRQAVREGFYLLPLHYNRLVEPLRGYPPFEALVTPRR